MLGVELVIRRLIVSVHHWLWKDLLGLSLVSLALISRLEWCFVMLFFWLLGRLLAVLGRDWLSLHLYLL